MYCNQPFCGTGQNYGYNIYNPPPPNTGTYSQIVGEGDVTSVTLPDGSFQLFFIPTVKWWSPSTSNTCPYYTNIINTNSPYCGLHGANYGAWFVRTITNPSPPVFNTTCPRYDGPIPFYSSECNFNAVNNGYHLKFHNDHSTSTSDIHYFYPCIRQLDCNLALPAQGCAAVQVTTPTANNTVCHYEFACSKPCHCTPKPCQVPAICQTASEMSLEDTSSKDVICECGAPSSGKTKKTNIKSGSRGRKIDRSSKDNICECDVPLRTTPSRSKLKTGSNDRICPKPLWTTKTKSKNADCDCRNSNAIALDDTKSTSSEVLFDCDLSLSKSKRKSAYRVSRSKGNRSSISLTKSRQPQCACSVCGSKDSKTGSNEVVCERAKSFAKQHKSKRKRKCACCVCNRKDTKSKSKEVICECAKSKRKCYCCVCGSREATKPDQVICECAESLAKRKSKCKGKCGRNKPNDVICECAQSLAERSITQTKWECYLCGSKDDKVVCECAESLAKRKSKCKGKCMQNKPNAVICECAQYLAEQNKPVDKCECCVCESKDRNNQDEVVCDCAQSLAKLSKTKAECECCDCDKKEKLDEVMCECDPFNKSKSKTKGVCCERCTNDDIQLQLLPTDGRRKRIKLDRAPYRATKSKSKDVICECAPPPCSNKSLATYTDQSCGGDPCVHVECQSTSCCAPETPGTKAEDFVYRCKVEPEMWRPTTASSRKRFLLPRTIKKPESSCSSSSCDGYRDTDDGNK